VDGPVGRTAPVLSRPLGARGGLTRAATMSSQPPRTETPWPPRRRAPLLAPVAFLERRGWPRTGGLRAVKEGDLDLRRA